MTVSRRKTFGITVLAIAAYALVCVYVWSDSRTHHINHARETVRETMQSHCIALSASINRHCSLLDGLRSFVEMELDDIDAEDDLQREIPLIAKRLRHQGDGIRALVVAPDDIGHYVYPVTGNESILDINLANLPGPKRAAAHKKAVADGDFVLSGPHEIYPGEQSLVAWHAVFHQGRYWGMVAMAIDLEPLLKVAELSPHVHKRDVALRLPGESAFWGDPAIFSQHPEIRSISMPGTSWELAAIPIEGWDSLIEHEQESFILVATFIGLLLAAIVWLIASRGESLRDAIDKRTRELDDIYRNAPVGLLQLDRDLRYVRINKTLANVNGYTVDQHLGKSVREILPEMADQLETLLRPVIEKGHPALDIEVTGKTPGNMDVEHTFLASYYPQYAGDGSIIGILGAVIDITERKRSERMLREVLGDLTNAQRVAKIGNWHLRLATGEFEWSDEMYHIFGLEPGSIAPTLENRRELIHPDDRAVWHSAFTTAIGTSRNFDIKYRIRRGNEVRHVRTIGLVSSDEKNVPESLYGTTQDVTELTVAAEALRDSESRYRTLIENSPDIFLRFDRSLRYRFASGNAELLTGLPAEAHLGKTAQELNLLPERRQPTEADLRNVFDTGTTQTSEATVCVDDKTLTFDIRLVPETNAEGEVETVLVILRDVSERRKLLDELHYRLEEMQAQREELQALNEELQSQHEEMQASNEELVTANEELNRLTGELKQSEEHLSITLNSIGDAVISSDTEGRIVRMNRMAEQMTGWTEEQAVGRRIEQVFDVIHAETRKPVTNRFERVLADKTHDHLSRDMILVARDRAERRIADNAAPILDHHGNIQGAVLVFRDVTEQTALQNRLNQIEKLEAIGQLAGGIAHDFNNMLGAILGQSQLIAKRLTDRPDLKKRLDRISETATKAAELTAQLLAFARQGQYRNIVVNIHSILGEVLALLEHSMDKRIELRMLLDAEHPFTRGDPTQLQSIFLNLGINACDAMPSGGELTFATATVELDEDFCERVPFSITAGPFLQVVVSDNGGGMDAATRNKIFEPFFTTKPVGAGTGLGLASVYGAVKNHKGAISVYSEIDRGTIFKIYLPLSVDGIEALAPAPDEPEPRHGQAHILIVDDEPDMRDTLADMLDLLGYSVVAYDNGQDAIEGFRKAHESIDLVIFDMVMPKISGSETFRALREIDPTIKTILSSGYSLEGEARAILDEGASGFIQKPYRLKHLAKVVSDILDS